MNARPVRVPRGVSALTAARLAALGHEAPTLDGPGAVLLREMADEYERTGRTPHARELLAATRND